MQVVQEAPVCGAGALDQADGDGLSLDAFGREVRATRGERPIYSGFRRGILKEQICFRM